MSFALLDYEPLDGLYNEGDYIQSLAALQYLPAVDKFVSREALSDYRGETLSMILNGWFMHRPQKWPPSNDIDPLFVSFHINRPFEAALTSPASLDYFRRFPEIGCRDIRTASILNERGVPAYYSGCLTLTLGQTVQHKPDPQGGDILLVDVAHAVPSLGGFLRAPVRSKLSHLRSGSILHVGGANRLIRKLIRAVPSDLRDRVKVLGNLQPGDGVSTQARLDLARARLEQYSRASLVITSRIHAALPCLAMGTPVLFIKYGQKSKSNMYRFRGIIDLMNVIDFDGDMPENGFESDYYRIEDIDFRAPPSNPTRHVPLAEALIARCRQWVDARR
ncbi:polysaccharide pyruvyl transferase family protein [Sphingopyxis sp. J-6]|uniref:polysaccharide pyruvyl transferase family protein n=1 Tax=Sphingopyxis sp. J-6 TaxID=3122054 RepID=UPI003983F1BC